LKPEPGGGDQPEPESESDLLLKNASGEIHHRCMNNIEIVNFVVDFAFVVTYIAIAVLPRAIAQIRSFFFAASDT